MAVVVDQLQPAEADAIVTGSRSVARTEKASARMDRFDFFELEQESGLESHPVLAPQC